MTESKNPFLILVVMTLSSTSTERPERRVKRLWRKWRRFPSWPEPIEEVCDGNSTGLPGGAVGVVPPDGVRGVAIYH